MQTVLAPTCPECRAEVPMPTDSMVAEVVGCAQCSTELEVVATAPIVLALAPEIDEDWGE